MTFGHLRDAEFSLAISRRVCRFPHGRSHLTLSQVLPAKVDTFDMLTDLAWLTASLNELILAEPQEPIVRPALKARLFF
jgi:hypothetical protein